jgi:hypothetical protein
MRFVFSSIEVSMEKIKAFFRLAYQVICALGAIACILVWIGIRPREVSGMTWPHGIWLIIGLILFAMSLYSSHRAWKPRKLVIHSALYGTCPSDDDDITRALRKTATDALVIDVTNSALGRLVGRNDFDPAPGRPKRLEVEYSYGSPKRLVATRPEGARLVLPEDFWIVEQMKKSASVPVVSSSPPEAKCPRCDGRGMVTCPTCKGQGLEIVLVVGTQNCARCYGKGEVQCPRCGGTGKRGGRS